MKLLSLIVVCISGLSLPAMSVASSRTGTVVGIVADSEDKTPIEYATVSIFNVLDSSLVSGGITSGSGEFSIEKIPFGIYRLEVRYLGYQTIVRSGITIEGKKTDLGTILLEHEEIEVDGVNIEEKRAVLEMKIDKKVFNAENSIASKGGTALDLLKDVPSVQVDQNETILLRGEAGVTILIDGRPVTMAANQYLKLLSASSVDKVEIITNPSAKYDVEGIAGILNIITKKNTSTGFNGNVISSVIKGSKFRTRETLSLNFRSGKFNLYSNYVFSHRRAGTSQIMTRSVLLGDSSWNHLYSTGYEFETTPSHALKGGIDFFANERNTFYVSGSYNTSNSSQNARYDYFNLDGEGNKVSSAIRLGPTLIPRGSFDVNGGWQRTFKREGSTLDLDLDYSENFYEATETFSEYGSAPDMYYWYQTAASRDDNTMLLGRADLTLPITDSIGIESGLYYRARTSDSWLRMQLKDLSLFEILTDLDNQFAYDETVLAAYGTFSRQWSRIGVKLGLRAEQTYITSKVMNEPQTFVNNYFKLYPTAHLSWQKTKTSSFTMSYGKRINRPTIQMLNPFTFYSDRYTQETGNPTLRPEIIHVGELGYLKQFGKLTINATLYNRYLLNRNRRYLTYENSVSEVTYKDVARSNMTGVEVLLTYRPVKKLNIQTTLNTWNYSLADEYLTDGEQVNNLGASIKVNSFLRLKHGISLQLRNFYRPKYLIQQGYMKPLYIMGGGVRKTLHKGKGYLNFYVSDILNTNGAYYVGYPEDDYEFTGDWKWETRMVYLTYSYSFGKKVRGKQKRSVKSEDGSDSGTIPGM